ncbi:MAG: hypothetical protein ABJC13_02840 [Acidobacteriota bacterium]
MTLPDVPAFSSVGRKSPSDRPKSPSKGAETAPVGRAGQRLDRPEDSGRFGAELVLGGPGNGVCG